MYVGYVVTHKRVM